MCTRLTQQLNPKSKTFFRRIILWHFSIAQLAFCRLLWWLWAQVLVSGASSTFWKVTVRTTLLPMLMVNKVATHKIRTKTATPPLFRTAKGKVATKLLKKWESIESLSHFFVHPQQEEFWPLKQLFDSKFSIVFSVKANTVFSRDVLVLIRL